MSAWPPAWRRPAMMGDIPGAQRASRIFWKYVSAGVCDRQWMTWKTAYRKAGLNRAAAATCMSGGAKVGSVAIATRALRDDDAGVRELFSCR